MAWYEYACPNGHRWEHMRPAAKRNDPSTCTLDGLPGHKQFSVPVIHWPRALWTQWSDVHSKSAKELAHDSSVERYDPSGPVAPVKEDRRAGITQAFNEALSKHGRPEGTA